MAPRPGAISGNAGLVYGALVMVISGSARAALGAIALGLCVTSCGAASAPPEQPTAAGRCDPADLDACARALSAALAEQRPVTKQVSAYVAARAARDPEDSWARLHRQLASNTATNGGNKNPSAAGRVAVIQEGSAKGTARAPGGVAGLTPLTSLTSLTSLETPALPAPEGIDATSLLLALGEATGHALIVHVRGGAALQLFPRDPLSPFLAGLPPAARGDASLASLVSDVAIAVHLRRAFEAAGAFRYLEAARAADALAAEVARRDPNAEPALRGRYALQLLAAAGIALEPAEGFAELPRLDPPPPSPSDTSYGDLLRVRTAKDEHAAWAARSASILRAVAPDRREALDNLLGKARGCAPPLVPPLEDARDLVFATRLAGALAPVQPAPSAAAASGGAAPQEPPPQVPPGTLPFKEWLGRYERLVSTVEATRTAWAHATSLLYQRGDALGMSLAGTPTYRRATDLGLRHIQGLRTLAGAEPARYRALAQIALAYSPGVLGDERLRDAIIDLTQSTLQSKLAAADDASGVWSGLITGLMTGMSYPPAVQPAHYLALQGAFTAKLRGDLTRRAGWGVAGLYAADAAYRLVLDQGPDLAFASAQIDRALSSDPALPYPGMAVLAVSLSRYAVLGVQRKLDPEPIDAARLSPERRDARASLRRALAALAGPGETPPPALLDDVTALADGLIAVVSSELAARPAQPAPDTCAADAGGPSPAARRALARLGDVRRRILLSPRYKAKGGAWARRVRLLVTLLSDGMDLAAQRGAKPAPALPVALSADKARAPRVRFTLPTAEAEATVQAALRDWDERDLADAITSAYGVARAYYEAPDAQRFLWENGGRLRKVVAGLNAFFRKDTEGAPTGATLLDALASTPDAASGTPNQTAANTGDLLVSYARSQLERGQTDQADFWLLASLVAGALTDAGPPEAAAAHAAQRGSRVAWVLRYLAEIHKAKRGVAPDPAVYAEGMRAATDDACARADADDVLAVMTAARDFSAGKRREARVALDEILDDAEARGLSVPRMAYRYEEKTATRIFMLSFNISYGAGLLEGPNTFQLGMGLRTKGEPEGAMVATLYPEGDATGDETARYYVHAAALSSALHFLDKDRDRAATAARRAISALTFGVRLGQRTLARQDPAAWGKDARALLAIDAQLAAEAGLPFLAGDLWTVVRAQLPRDADDAAVAALLDPLPASVAALPELKPVAARAARALTALAAPLPCTEAKAELGAFEAPACDAYPLALSLRIADALKKLPHLRPAGSAAQCAPLARLDAFLMSAERGTYDPDAFTQAVEALRADGRLYDAAVLLTRQRHEGHCGPALVAAARALGRAPALGPALRADLLSVAVNCTSTTLSEPVVDDLLALDRETRLLPDLGRNLRVVLSIAELAQRAQRWDLLQRLTAQPDFVERWMKVSPHAATGALLIEQAAALLAETASPPRPGAAATYDLLCQTFPPADRAALCGDVAALRAARSLPRDQRRRRAEEALERLIAQPAGAPGP